jgi:hypothetical protein
LNKAIQLKVPYWGYKLRKINQMNLQMQYLINTTIGRTAKACFSASMNVADADNQALSKMRAATMRTPAYASSFQTHVM